MLGLAAVSQLACGLPFRQPPLLAGAVLLGFSASAAKICVDTIVQRDVDDRYRGRVFSLYDTLFNITFVGAAVATAVLLPDSGYSPASVIAIGVVYALTGLAYLRFAGRLPPIEAPPPAPGDVTSAAYDSAQANPDPDAPSAAARHERAAQFDSKWD